MIFLVFIIFRKENPNYYLPYFEVFFSALTIKWYVSQWDILFVPYLIYSVFVFAPPPYPTYILPHPFMGSCESIWK